MSTEPIQAAGRRIRIELDNADADPCHHFTKDGPVEIWLVADEQPIDAAGATDQKMIVLCVSLPNYPLARQHAERLQLLTGALEAAIADAQADATAAIPTLDDGHRHVVRFARYARKLPYVAMCEVCMQELVEDVNGWARDRGLMDGDPGRYVGLTDAATIKDAIEQAVNRG